MEITTTSPMHGGTINKQCYACREGLTGEEKTCYACRNCLTGDFRQDGSEWECFCETWECDCKEVRSCYCPICSEYFSASDYLATVFSDPATLWLANMVTHYRHEHRAWDRSHGFISRKYGQATYHRQKARINEQAKRQIIRKAAPYLLAHGVGVECFARLQGTEEKTMELAKKKLRG